VSPSELEAWTRTVESWHEFFMMAGTAAVTLAGLLFVAISLHIDALVRPQREALLAIARGMLMSFLFLLALSLLSLMPDLTRRLFGAQCISMGVAGTLVMLFQLRGLGAHDHPHFTRRSARRRLMIPVVGFVWMAVGGLQVASKDPTGFQQVMIAVVILLANATGASWDLLVRVARVRRADEEARVAAKPEMAARAATSPPAH
jgi:hypothetical protein